MCFSPGRTLCAAALGALLLATPSIRAQDEPLDEAPHAEATHSESETHAEAEHAEEHGGAHDEPHDPYDLGHGNASPMIEDPSEFRSDLAIWTFVVFLLLLALLGKFAWGPIVQGLDRREQAIADKIDEAKRSADQAAQRLQEYEARLAAAGEEAREIVAGARRDAEVSKERILAEAQQAAERERLRAVEDINAAKNVALQEITDRSVDLAEAMARQLLHRELQAEDRAQLVREALAQLPQHH